MLPELRLPKDVDGETRLFLQSQEGHRQNGKIFFFLELGHILHSMNIMLMLKASSINW